MHRKHVCIVTPGHLSTNPRVMKEATALHGEGCSITIICGNYIPDAARGDCEMAHPEWTLRHVPFGRKLTNPVVHIRQRAEQALARLVVRLGAVSSENLYLAHAPIASDLVSAACAVPADLYIAHYVAALPAAAKAAEKHRACYAFDAEDFHLGDLPEAAEHKLDRSLVRAIESKYLPNCNYVTAASPGIADAYVAYYDIKRPKVVLNTFPLAQAPSGPTAIGSTTPGPSIYWFSQTIGPNRGLECAVEAIARARTKPHLYLRGSLANGFGEKLLQIAAQYHAEGRVHCLQPAPPDDLERLAAVYDLGLIAETGETFARQVCLTNKLFSYLLAGVPPIMSDTLAHKAFAEDAGLEGHIYRTGDTIGLANLIDGFLENPERLAAARLNTWNLAQERYNWDLERATFLGVVRAKTGNLASITV
jgi:glycosyltransferase involved in cell wall biosynthesis